VEKASRGLGKSRCHVGKVSRELGKSRFHVEKASRGLVADENRINNINNFN
jgi:hypothetical protein